MLTANDRTEKVQCHANPKSGAHCFHGTGQMKLSDPPIDVYRCCWCGEIKDVRRAPEVILRPEHGRHL